MTDQSRDQATIGLTMTMGIVVGTMIGSGIFMLPVALAPLGANAVVGWLVSIVGALAIAFALSRLSRLGSGGMQSYIEQELGETPAFVTSWTFWWSNWVSVAAVAIAFGSAMSRLYPAFGQEAVVPLAIGAIALLTVVNMLGVRASARLNLVTIAIKVIPLIGVVLLLVAALMTNAPIEPLASAPITVASIATATTLALFALAGFENATTPVGKIRDIERTLPRAILGGTVLVGLLYLLSSTGITSLLPAATVAQSPAPYADIFAKHGGENVVRLAALAIAISAFGALNCVILAVGELGYAMALRRQLPSVMAKTRGFNTPYVAQIVGSLLAAALVVANSSRSTAKLFEFAILLSTSGVLVVYLAGAMSAWKISRSNGARAAIFVAFLFIAFAAYGSGWEADMWCLVLIAVGIGIYALMRAINSRATSPAVATAPAAPRE